MDPSLTSVYLHQAGDVFRVGYGPLQTVTGGSFTVDAQEVARLTTTLEAAAAKVKAAEEAAAQAKADAEEQQRLQAEAQAALSLPPEPAETQG